MADDFKYDVFLSHSSKDKEVVRPVAERLIPIILPDVEQTPDLPLFVRQTVWVDMRNWENDQDDGFYRLVCGILGKAPGDSPMKRFGVRDVAEWQGTVF